MGSRLKVDFDQVTTKRPGGISRYAWALKRTKSELSNVDVWRAVGAEFLATFFFMFIVCLTLMIPQTVQGKPTLPPIDFMKHERFSLLLMRSSFAQVIV